MSRKASEIRDPPAKPTGWHPLCSCFQERGVFVSAAFREAFPRYGCWSAVEGCDDTSNSGFVNVSIREKKVHKSRFAYVLGLAFLVLFLSACEREKIGDINADPGRYRDKEARVAGRVTQSFGALGRGIYQIEDGTGSLWVLSESRGVPTKGAMVGVKGKVSPTVTFLGVNYATVMLEADRRSGS